MQLGLAYDVIRPWGTVELRAAGYRVIRGNNEHYRSIGGFGILDRSRTEGHPDAGQAAQKGNVGAYDDYGLVSQNEANACGKMSVRVRKDIEDWIRKNYWQTGQDLHPRADVPEDGADSQS